jgi:hypothetical protein
MGNIEFQGTVEAMLKMSVKARSQDGAMQRFYDYMEQNPPNVHHHPDPIVMTTEVIIYFHIYLYLYYAIHMTSLYFFIYRVQRQLS